MSGHTLETDGAICASSHMITSSILQGCSGLVYPPHSPHAALQSLFLQGAADRAAWHAKLALLLYYTLDAGLPVTPASFWCSPQLL